MRLAVLTRYFFPAENGKTIKKGQGADIRIYELYSRLAKENKISIVTQKFASAGKFSFSNLSFSSENFEGMEIRRTPCPAPFFFLTRFPSLFRFIDFLRVGKKSDILIAEFHPFHFIGKEALIAKYLLKKPLVLDVHDIAPEDEGGILGRIYLCYEKFIASRADGIIATSPEQAQRFKRLGIRCPIVAVENGVDTEKRVFLPGMKGKQGLEGKKVIGLMGSLTPQHGAGYLIRALPEILKSEPNAVLLLIGGGRDREKLQALASSLGVPEKVILAGLVPYEKVNECLSACDVLAAPFPKGREYTTNLPLKLPEYLSMGIPVVVTNGPVLKRIVEESGAGFVAEAENEKSISNAILSALRNPEVGKKGRAYAEKNLDWGILAKRMENFLGGFA